MLICCSNIYTHSMQYDTRGTGDTKYICYIKEITRIGTRLIIKWKSLLDFENNTTTRVIISKSKGIVFICH